MRTINLTALMWTILAASVCFGEPIATPVPRSMEVVAKVITKLGIDEYRAAITKREVVLSFVLMGRWAEAESVLTSIEHYSAPSTIAEAILVGWDRIPVPTALRWFDLADKKMYLTAGRDSGKPTSQLSRLWITLMSRPNLPPPDSNFEPKFFSTYPPKLKDNFRRLLEPDWWTQFVDRLNPRSPWAELSPKHTEEEKKIWKENRIIDGFTGRILMAEAIRRANIGEIYPNTWISFVIGGMEGTSFNSDAIRLTVSSYQLAKAEKKTPEATDLAARLRIMLPQVTPTSFGAYEAAMFAALACGPDGPGRDELVGGLTDLQVRADRYLNEYEKMRVYSHLGAGLVVLGKSELGNSLFRQVMIFAENNKDPESKRIGVIRLELGLALASRTQTPQEYQKIVKILADADRH